MDNTYMKKYKLLSNLKFTMQSIWKMQKSVIILALLNAPLTVGLSYLAIYLSKEIITAVTQQKTPGDVLLLITFISLVLLFANTFKRYLDGKSKELVMAYDMKYQVVILDKCVRSDYENMENLAGLERIWRAVEQAGSDRSAVRIFARLLPSLSSNIIGVVSYAAILINLNIWIMLAVTVSTISGFFILKMTASWSYRNKENWTIHDRKLSYLRSVSCKSFVFYE